MTIFTSATDLFHIVTVQVNEKHVFTTKFSIKSNRNIARGREGEREREKTKGLSFGDKRGRRRLKAPVSADRGIPFLREANLVSPRTGTTRRPTSPIGHAI